MTAKQQAFIREYLIDFNATAAAKRAGYSPRTADRSGPRLLGNVGIQAALTEAIQARAKRRSSTRISFSISCGAPWRRTTHRWRRASDPPSMLGKHLGMWSEKLTVTSTPPPPMRLVIVDALEPGFDPTHPAGSDASDGGKPELAAE